MYDPQHERAEVYTDASIDDYIMKMRNKTDFKLQEMIEQEFQSQFEEEHDQIRTRVKEQILKVQSENRKTYNLRRKMASKYKLRDIVAIKRT